MLLRLFSLVPLLLLLIYTFVGGGGTLDKVKEKLGEKETRGEGQQPVKIKDMWIRARAD